MLAFCTLCARCLSYRSAIKTTPVILASHSKVCCEGLERNVHAGTVRPAVADECDGGGAEVAKTNSLSRETEEDQSVGGS